ncbi:GYDIA family GHMP kinase [Flavobacterium degerlachei]|jgi:mevalonate kinase|uniref:Mevalonate kinase n=1 Tax=Flavobacterium degerlachei TaxID=229203 RepID=A0A1H2Y779_9FLAO|nr:GYDIA family GHMP kinase [Flavobacterium degerlachei]SDX00678.1 Mevalonate kinase [Flavobacterium degerlachei]
MKKTFYSNGKLLITAEYLVLDGAKALALPTKFGQNLIVEEGSNHKIAWKSYDSDGSIWFEDNITFSEIANPTNSETETETEAVKATLVTILHEAYLLNPDLISDSNGYQVTTQLTFPKKWGLGTSSTLINNIAQWLQIDAFKLLKTSFGGSGYDIACAQNDSPILYHLEKGEQIVEKATFNPAFANSIYFVYLNKKQSSKSSIAQYRKNKAYELDKNIITINNITEHIQNADTITSFAKAISNHEAEMSRILETKTVKETLFNDFDGAIKSLGAWGGDFILVTAETNPTDYFKSKGYNTILTYEEMILRN